MKRLFLMSALVSMACTAEPTVVESSAVVTLPATDVSGTTATLAGTVNPHGVAAEGWFEWSRSSSLEESTVTPTQVIESGSIDVALAASLTKLVPDDTYYFRAVASSARGTVTGSILSFTTPLPPSTYTIPYQLGGNLSNSVTGFVWPNGHATLAWFEYGTDSTFGVFVQTAKQSIGSGMERVEISETLPGLQRNTTYYLRVMGSNAGGTTAGNVAWFTTGWPPQILNSGFYARTGCDTATLYAWVSANFADTRAWFEYATTAEMTDYVATPPQRIIFDTTRPMYLGVTLPMASPFYFRAVATNWLGTVRDDVKKASAEGCRP